MLSLEGSAIEIPPLNVSPDFDSEIRQNQAVERRVWREKDVAKLLPILGVVENHLRRLAHQPDSDAVVELVFRSMSGLYRYAAHRGMSDFCALAYEVAHAFAPTRDRASQSTRRAAALALVAIGQMRCLLSPTPKAWHEKHAKNDGNERQDRNMWHDDTQGTGGHAKDIIVGLLTHW